MTFWLIVTIGCLAWYAGVTAYVAVKGVLDIRAMLEKIGKREEPPP
jgi:hypothetical protein